MDIFDFSSLLKFNFILKAVGICQLHQETSPKGGDLSIAYNFGALVYEHLNTNGKCVSFLLTQ